jgi:hypothetical protein
MKSMRCGTWSELWIDNFVGGGGGRCGSWPTSLLSIRLLVIRTVGIGNKSRLSLQNCSILLTQ